jgi:lysozyme
MPQVSSRAKALAVVIALIGSWEGIRYVAYLPTPNDVWTICRGHTMGVKPGDTATPEQCDRYTEVEASAALDVVDRNVTVQLTAEQRGAFGDFVYNMGAGAFKASTMLEKLNAGDILGACVDLIDWRKQKRITLDGLVNRRKDEIAYCVGARTAP